MGNCFQLDLPATRHHDWVYSLAASAYWRTRGEPEEAVRCLRRSLRRAPGHYAHYVILSLANMLEK